MPNRLTPGVAGDPDLVAGAVDVDLTHGCCPAGAAEAHRAQGDRRDAQSAAPELSVFHDVCLCFSGQSAGCSARRLRASPMATMPALVWVPSEWRRRETRSPWKVSRSM